MKICVTGSLGLIGSAATQYFLDQGHTVFGIDNNQRKKLFGKLGDSSGTMRQFSRKSKFVQYTTDITSQSGVQQIFRKHTFDAVIHCAGQPSHDRATKMIAADFKINAFGTLNLLQQTQQYSPKASFIFTSTNKVYGSNPNDIPTIEQSKRYVYKDSSYRGTSESMSTDQTLHSFFGASKLAADTYTQEFGKYLGLKTTTLRLGCVTGPNHAGVKLHGFLSFLIKSLVHKSTYEIIGYKGKQVRDQIHATDVASAFAAIIENPNPGSVYNLGGGRQNSASILELIDQIEKLVNKKMHISYKSSPRKGDHICYITDLTKFQNDYPKWKIEHSLKEIVIEMVNNELKKM